MREIKFRAWDKDENSILYDGREYVSLTFDKHGHHRPTQLNYDHDYIQMQYVGLRDRNGVEIYEGDILKIDWGHWNECWANGVPDDSRELGLPQCSEHGYDIEEVKFEQGGFWPCCNAGQEGAPRIDMYEVIGNKFENSELLEQSNA